MLGFAPFDAAPFAALSAPPVTQVSLSASISGGGSGYGKPALAPQPALPSFVSTGGVAGDPLGGAPFSAEGSDPQFPRRVSTLAASSARSQMRGGYRGFATSGSSVTAYPAIAIAGHTSELSGDQSLSPAVALAGYASGHSQMPGYFRRTALGAASGYDGGTWSAVGHKAAEAGYASGSDGFIAFAFDGSTGTPVARTATISSGGSARGRTYVQQFESGYASGAGSVRADRLNPIVIVASIDLVALPLVVTVDLAALPLTQSVSLVALPLVVSVELEALPRKL